MPSLSPSLSPSPEPQKPVNYKEDTCQPWKAFWPPKIENLAPEELQKMPWLTWEPDPDHPDGKPWYDWMGSDADAAPPGAVCRRGAG